MKKFRRGKNYFIITFLSIFIAALIGIMVFYLVKPVYESDIGLIIYKSEVVASPEALPTNYNDTLMYQQLVKTYCEIVKSKDVAQDVINTLQLSISVEQLQSMVSVAPKANTQFLNITVKSNNPYESAIIANQIGISLIRISTHVIGSNFVNVLGSANIPVHPDSPNIILIIVSAFFISFIVCLAFLQIRKYRKSAIELES